MNPDEETKPVNSEPPVEQAASVAQPMIEDQTVQPAPTPAAQAAVQPVIKKTPWYTLALRYLLVAVIFFMAGAAVIYFVYALPSIKQVDTLNAAATESAQTIEGLKTDLAQTKADLQTAQTTITDDKAALDAASLRLLVSKMQKDVTTARIALLSLDPGGATQALSFAQNDLETLATAGADVESIAGFQDRLDEASANLESDPTKSLAALEKLMSSLYLLETNLE